MLMGIALLPRVAQLLPVGFWVRTGIARGTVAGCGMMAGIGIGGAEGIGIGISLRRQ